ncbi:hypothetical protein AZE42_07457 [Rhizopogon vesiculosus]|uniref:LysM domain-containing protein n=1 Tax=Rhizopogon vesiculosus TaxID=180088 RepID=A0A1J8PWW6_9AGAM|nr:hypothetical protein AZE42_07457 [Rhizopogon vesiculosus]
MHTSFSTATFAALMALASVVAGTKLPDGCTRTAQVESGNTCDDISAAYNVSTYVPPLSLLNYLFIQDIPDTS